MTAQEVIIKQNEISLQINRALSNFKKSKARITKSYIEARLELLESNFQLFKNNHFDIMTKATQEEKKTLTYFQNDTYYTCEDIYLEFKTLMKEKLEEWFISSSSSMTKEEVPVSTSGKALRLPTIEIPAFSGSYNEWTGFYDLFKSLIHDNAQLSNVEKYHYLKSNLKGEAETLLKQFPLTEANYTKALEVLESRYDNKRLIVHSHITRLLNQRKLTIESAKGLRVLLDTTNEVLNALNNVGVSTINWDPLITHIIVTKFDNESQRLWEQQLAGTREIPTTKQMLDFLEVRFRSLEALSVTQHKEVVTRQPIRSFKTDIQVFCSFCSNDHHIYNCKEFLRLSPEKRRDAVQEKQLCFNCLVPGHSVRFCKQLKSCKVCKRRHHSLLHLTAYDMQQAHATQVSEEEDNEDKDTSQLAVHKANITDAQVLLATALVRVIGKDGKKYQLRALIDQGSQASFITTSVARRLGLRKERHFSKVTGIDSKLSMVSREVAEFDMFSLYNDTPIVKVEAHVLKSLASILPRQEMCLNLSPDIKTLSLADPTFSKPNGVDILLGAEIYAQIIKDGLKRYGSVIAQNSLLGWFISGKVEGKHTEIRKVVLMHSQLETDKLLQRFWESEELHTKNRIYTANEIECETIFEKTHSRTDSGRYIVALPFSKYNGGSLGESRSVAVKRLLQIEQRFQKNKIFKERYLEFMYDYEQSQHMEKVPPEELDKSDVCYLPHHGVLKEERTTTKLRVVFDGSAETSMGTSLNKQLLIGPALQSDIRDIFLRWRTHRICLVADIKQMYRQILVRTEDQDYQRILWRRDPTKPIIEYRLRTVTYGTSCAPYLAIKVLKQLAKDECGEYPHASHILESDFYVDDLLSGCDTELEAINLQKDLTALLQRGGMVLHKWGTNSKNVMSAILGDDIQPQESYEIIMEKSIKTLGIKWNPKEDRFELSFKFGKELKSKLTKREVLADIARIYDPLGWMSPIVIIAKVFIQKLWSLGLSWDEELPKNLQLEWLSYRDQIVNMPVIYLPRWIGMTRSNARIEIHGFSDASNIAYAGVVYVRIIHDSQVQVKIIASKTKVAPLKQLSIPRLELCATVLTAKLMERIKSSLNICDDHVFGWTDSTIVLAWLQKPPNFWKTFVGNRVSEIINVTRINRWHHVNTKENPADCASRGISPAQLTNYELWWNGPQWLHTNKDILFNNEYLETDLELKANCIQCLSVNDISEEFILCKYSNLTTLKRVLAYILRFIKISKQSVINGVNLRDKNISSEFPKYLTTNELIQSMNCCIKISQACHFQTELNELSNGKCISKKSSLYFLRPFIDEHNILRIGGRLKNAPIPYDAKHPIVISGKSQLAKLIIDYMHKRTLHGGPLLMLNIIRSTYWITNVKSLVKSHVKRCICCIRHAPKFATQLMGNLPSTRVTVSKPFCSSGVDFAGPCYLKSSKLKRATLYKAYIAVFICTSTKAIHLELVSELSTNAFIAAFKRFTSRRGHCAHLFSDCGSNFIGANFELTKMLNKTRSSLPVELREILATDGTEWHFIPPGSPHFGGLWEAGVRSTKHHINRVLGDTKLTFEEYATLLTQIESCLNSRPISALTDSIDDYTALSPGHFLVFGPPCVIPHEDVTDTPMNRLNRWQHIEHMLQSFWKRWSQEYLVTLQHRYKWHSVKNPVKINDLVIVKNELLPPSKWLLGRILQVHPGNDGIVRVVTIKCKNNVFKRPITKICLLPIES